MEETEYTNVEPSQLSSTTASSARSVQITPRFDKPTQRVKIELDTIDGYSTSMQTIAFEDLEDKPEPDDNQSQASKNKAEHRQTRISLSPTDRATKRVIAPYVKVVRRNEKFLKDKEEEERQFQLYLLKKPSAFMRDLSTLLSDSVSLMSTLFETAEVIKEMVNATGVTLYIADEVAGEICQCPRNVLSDRHRVTWKIEQGKTVAQYVAAVKEYVMVDEVLGDVRFLDGCGYQDQTIKSVLCLPLLNPQNECLAVLELYRNVKQPNFEQEDLKSAVLVTSWAGSAIHQNQLCITLQKREELNDYLFHLVKCYFSNTLSIEQLISEIVEFAKDITGAQRGSFYVVNKNDESIEVDVFEENFETPDGKVHKKNSRMKVEPDTILGIVADSGETINISDAYRDSRYNSEQDDKNGIITTSLLCAAVAGAKEILGMVQLTNKKMSLCFTPQDQNLMKLVSLYGALALHYFNLSTSLHKTEKLNECYADIIRYHMAPCCHDLEHFSKELEVVLPIGFDNLTWYITPDLRCYMPQFTMSMMVRLVGEDKINKSQMMKFILSTRKLYRDNPYHNYEHGFHVFHTMYSILLLNFDKFSLLERQAFCIATLCHDIDHPAFSNNFLLLTNDPLTQLYDSSSLEHHHYNLTMILLQENKVFNDMSCCEFKQFTFEIKHMILTTDLSLHMTCRKSLTQILPTFEWQNSNHRNLLKELMMTMCDISGQCLPFLTTRTLTDALYKEFYNEGDILKTMGVEPVSLMDRDKQDNIPEDQIKFLSVIAIPCFELLGCLLPNIKPLLTEAENNREVWREQMGLKGQKCWSQSTSVAKNNN